MGVCNLLFGFGVLLESVLFYTCFPGLCELLLVTGAVSYYFTS